jgi:hypothetical protein
MPNMALTIKGMDDISSSSWLSLDSSRSEDLVQSKAMLQQVTTGEYSMSKNFTIGKTVVGEEHTVDIIEQPRPGPHVLTASRKPRTRRSKLNANIGSTVERINP